MLEAPPRSPAIDFSPLDLSGPVDIVMVTAAPARGLMVRRLENRGMPSVGLRRLTLSPAEETRATDRWVMDLDGVHGKAVLPRPLPGGILKATPSRPAALVFHHGQGQTSTTKAKVTFAAF